MYTDLREQKYLEEFVLKKEMLNHSFCYYGQFYYTIIIVSLNVHMGGHPARC